MANEPAVVLPLVLKNDTKDELKKLAADINKAEAEANELSAALKTVAKSGTDIRKLSQPLQELARRAQQAEMNAKALNVALSSAKNLSSSLARSAGLGGLAGGLMGGSMAGVVSGILGDLKDVLVKEFMKAMEIISKSNVGGTQIALKGGSGEKLSGTRGREIDVMFNKMLNITTLDDKPELQKASVSLAGDFGRLEGEALEVAQNLHNLALVIHAVSNATGLSSGEAGAMITKVSRESGTDLRTSAGGIVQAARDSRGTLSGDELSKEAEKSAKMFKELGGAHTVLNDALQAIVPTITKMDRALNAFTNRAYEIEALTVQAGEVLRDQKLVTATPIPLDVKELSSAAERMAAATEKMSKSITPQRDADAEQRLQTNAFLEALREARKEGLLLAGDKIALPPEVTEKSIREVGGNW